MGNVSLKELQDITIQNLLKKEDVEELLDIVYNEMISAASQGKTRCKYIYCDKYDAHKAEVIKDVATILTLKGFETDAYIFGITVYWS